MKKEMNPGGINTGNPLETTICPFSAERLHELYWHEKKSSPKIAQLAAAILGHPISNKCVRGWLRKARIPIRSACEAHRIRLLDFPHLREVAKQTMKRNVQSENHRTGTPEIMRRIGKKGLTTVLRNRQARRITKPCSWPPCEKLISRPPSGFTSEFAYCSCDCKTKHRRWLKKCRALEPLKEEQNEHYHIEMRRLAREVLGIDLPQHPPES